MMQDISSMVAALQRPRLLVRAARFGVDEYRRAATLPRLLQCLSAPRPGEAIMQLIAREAELNQRRLAAAADYSVARHVEMLIALLGEARLLRAARAPDE